MLKSKSTVRTKNVVPLVQQAKRRILLSGTATPSRPIELYTQILCLKPDGQSVKEWFLTRAEYSVRYCDGHKEFKGHRVLWNEKGHSNLKELNIMLNRDFMLRRLKKDALPELSPKVRKVYRLTKAVTQSSDLSAILNRFDKQTMTKVFQDFIDKAEAKSLSGDSEKKLQLGPSFSTESKRKDFAQLYKNTGLAKVKAVCAFAERKVERGHKTIVFAHHREVLDLIEDFLVRKEVGFIRIDGSVAIAKRFDLVKSFQRFDYCKIALLSINATGVGLTLTAARRVIFAEIDFVPARLLQCEDRAHRIGQKEVVKVYYVLAKKTLDDFVWPMIRRKLVTVSTTLDGFEKDSMKINSSTSFDQRSSIKEKNLDEKVKLRQSEINFN